MEGGSEYGEAANKQRKVQITQEVYEVLEIIRQSGATNMLDRPMVIYLAREWELDATVDWIESVDAGTYGRPIFMGPEVIDNDPADQW